LLFRHVKVLLELFESDGSGVGHTE
jgi:hypothetical protein